MKCIVRRTCREIHVRDAGGRSVLPSRPVEEWDDKAAYVLLGPPGSGKTTVFKHEAERQGGLYVTVRDFLAFDDKPGWRDTTLFVDGLDEARAGTADGRTPLDSIRAKLDRIGQPRFRLSCREADWFGGNDNKHLKTAAPDGAVTVLRLDPLSRHDICQILGANLGVADPEDFIASAEGKSLQELLANPQSLKMLARAVGKDGVWPGTRTQAFEKACRVLLEEHNEEHRIANHDRVGIPDLMDAVGRLCAVQLLTGAAGYSFSGEDSDLRFLEIHQLPGQDRETLRSCFRSKLFEAPTECRVVPVHRVVAEFLAARYLAALVRNGLPIGRILALITGHDGVTVSELRGLAAWLAVHSKSGRREIITRDPLGTVLYGDAKDFSPDEKCQLLDGLKRETAANPRLIATVQLDSRIGDLVSFDMEVQFREFLTDPSREDPWQSFIVILLEALQQGEALPGLAGPLMKLIRDDTCWPTIRIGAIDAFVRHLRNDREGFKELKALTADIYAGKIPDLDDALLGYLLTVLYPVTISETEIMQYLRLPRRPNHWSEYNFFWTGHLPKSSTRDQLVVLLDELAKRYGLLLSEDTERRLPASFLRRLPLNLLARFLSLSGDEVNLDHLFDWLGSAAYSGGWKYHSDLGPEESRSIRKWLENRPGAWKTLLAMCIRQCADQSECGEPNGFAVYMRKEMHGRLFGVERPPDFGFWCLDQVIAAEDANASDWFLGEIADCLHYGRFNEGLSQKVVSHRLSRNAGLQDAFDRRMAELEALASDENISERSAKTHFRTEHPDWHEHVKPHEDALRSNTARPELLHELATAYFGGYLNVRGDSPRDRLMALLAGDVSLVEAVLSGFRGTTERDDLPSDRQIIRLGTSNRTHHLALPFMAGLDEIARTAPFGVIGMDDKKLRLGLAVHYTVPMWPSARQPTDRPPRWYVWLLSNRSEHVADVLVRSALSKLRSGAESPVGINKLARSPDHARVARVAALALLERFPLRCTSGQLSSLNHLLLAARRHCDTEALLDLIDEKHADRRMSVAQRIHWMAAGLCIAPDRYVELLDAYTVGRERRVRLLAEAVSRQFNHTPDLECCRSVPALRFLVGLIGASSRPYSLGADSDEGVIVTPEMNVAERVRDFIEQLAAVPTEDASLALEALSSDDDLHPWHSLITDAAFRQKAVRREAEFAYGDFTRVLGTLDGGSPANVADLAALTFEHLNEIARDIRDGNLSGWRQYWNVDQYNRPWNPRPEDSCRDALLSDLRRRMLRLEIDAQPEGRYADDKRADIRVSRGPCNVPIEIKRSCHRDLWSAIRSQLIARYTRDPGTGGHGIYLVFWFGVTEGCRPTPPVTGTPPANSAELEHRLLSTLSADERLKIRICVIDVTGPDSVAVEPTRRFWLS